jgi:hypothetical protein
LFDCKKDLEEVNKMEFDFVEVIEKEKKIS